MQNVGLEWTLIDTWVTLGEVSASPSGGAIIPATIKVYSKDKAGTSALYLMDDAGSEREIAPPNTVTGTGTANRLAYWSSSSVIAANAALTSGRIPFADSNGLPADDSALVWDNTNKRVGVGAASPLTGIHLSSSTAALAKVRVDRLTTAAAAFSGFSITGSATVANAFLAFFGGGGSHDGTAANAAETSLMGVYAGELWTSTAKGSYITFETTPNASVTRAERLRVTDTTLQPGTTLVMNLGTSALRFLRLWGGDVEMADQAAPSAPASGNALLFSFNQQGFSVLHVTDSTNAQIEIARDNYVVAKNTSGVTINKGQAVYITGATGNVPNVAKAKADSLTTLPAVGVMFETTTNNSFGRVMYAGNVENFDTSAFTAGDKLWVSTVTAGALTNTRPTPSSTSFPQHIASVLTSGVGNGNVYVNARDVEGVLASDTDPLSQYALLAGRSGGQTLIGGTGSGDDLTLQSSSNATRGDLITDVADITMVAGSRARMSGQNRFRYLNSMARVYRTSTQSISNSTLTAIQFDNEKYDTDGLHDNVTNNSRLTAVLAGKYHLSAGAEFQGPAGTYFVLVRIVLNGTTVLSEGRQIAATGSSDIMSTGCDYVLAANDYIEAFVFQTSGGSVNIGPAAASDESVFLAMHYIGE